VGVSNLPRVRSYLCQGHLGDDGEHDLLALGRVRVLDVFVQPSLERARRLASGVLASHVQRSVTARDTATVINKHGFISSVVTNLIARGKYYNEI